MTSKRRMDMELMRCKCKKLGKRIHIKYREDSCDYVFKCKRCKSMYMKNLRNLISDSGEFEYIVTDIEKGSLKWRELHLEL